MDLGPYLLTEWPIPKLWIFMHLLLKTRNGQPNSLILLKQSPSKRIPRSQNWKRLARVPRNLSHMKPFLQKRCGDEAQTNSSNALREKCRRVEMINDALIIDTHT